jgi:DNA-binding response OmpR family regulator
MFSKSILIVDDTPCMGDLLTAIVEERYKNEFLIICFENPLKASKLFNTFLPDVLITDYQMPGINGIALAIQAKKKNSSISTLLVTGTFDINPPEISMLKGFNIQIIHKPFRPEQIYVWIDAISKSAANPVPAIAPVRRMGGRW